MIQRHKDIVIDLIHSSMPVREISTKYKVTDRTIRNDLKEISCKLCQYGCVLEKNSKGEYFIKVNDDKLFEEFETKHLLDFKFDFSDPKNRVTYIALKFLFIDGYLKLEDLTEQMYISRSTIQNDMKDVRDYLQKFDIDFETKPNYGLKVVGSEKNIRNAISTLINKLNEGFAGSKTKDLSHLFDQDILEDIYQIVVDRINKSEIKLSDIALNNLVLHIAIAIKRIKINQYFNSKIDLDLKSNAEYTIAKSIVEAIEDKFSLTFPVEEITYITMHLMGTKLMVKEGGDVVLSQEEEELFAIAKKLVEEVDKKLHFDIRGDHELITSIVMHLKPAIYRYHNNMNIRNPLLDSIKTNYPVAYEASLIAAEVLDDTIGIKFNEDELGYIAIHLGTAIERAKLQTSPIRTLLVCTTGVGSSKLLKYKLRSKFGDQLDIVDTTEMYNIGNYMHMDLDLIITTVPFSRDIKIPYIFITDILGDSNFDEISKFIESKRKKSIKFLDIDDIYMNLDCQTKDECLEFLTNRIVEKGKAPDNLLSLIKKREDIITTAFGNLVAIPHPFEPVSDETFITLATLENPIDWAGKPVQVVILLNVAKESSQDFESMYEILLDLIDSKDNVQTILKAKNEYQIYKLFTKNQM